jgi:hypothetical protein
MRINGIIKVLYSLILTTTFLLPSVVQLTHLSENHEHSVCFDNSDHVHSLSYDCSIQDFQLTPFDFDPLYESNKIYRSKIGLTESHYTFLANKKLLYTSKNLRAPPYFS